MLEKLKMSLGAVFLLSACSTVQAQSADRVFLSDNILTSNPDMPRARSIGVSGDTIICVRVDDSCRDMAAEDAEIVDAGPNTITAGLIDTHLHTRLFGQTQAVMLNLFKYNDATREEVVDAIREYASTLDPDEWVIGGGWSDKHFQNPTKEELDEIVGGRPALLSDNTQHNGWYSTKALEFLGVDGKWTPPKGGYMELNDKGEPKGLLEEKAHLSTGFVAQHKLYSHDKQEEAIKVAARLMNSKGVTGAIEAAGGSREGSDDVYVRLARKGELNLRHEATFVYWSDGTDEGDKKMIAQLEMRRQAVKDAGVDPNFLSTNTIKFAIDGTPGRFAHMELPYLDGTHPDMNFTPENLGHIFDQLTESGFRVMLHVEGNAAIRKSLDALEYADRTGEPLDPDARNIFTHLDHVSVDTANRMQAMGALAQLQLHWADPNEEYFVNVVKNNVSRHLLAGMHNHKLVVDTLEYGVGPDAPTSPIWSPWDGIQIALTRQPLDDPGATPLPGEPLTLEEALHGYTLGSARVQKKDHIVGSLEEGKKADIAILDRDIEAQAETDIYRFHEIKALRTYLNGELVHEDTDAIDEYQHGVGLPTSNALNN